MTEGEIVAPAVALLGFCRNARLLAAAGLTVIALVVPVLEL